MSSNAERFAERVKERMRELGLRTHDDVEERGGPSSPTMTAILNARSGSLSSTTAKKLETALDLARGSASRSFEDDTDLEPAATIGYTLTAKEVSALMEIVEGRSVALSADIVQSLLSKGIITGAGETLSRKRPSHQS